MTKSGVLPWEKKSKIVKTCFLHELNDSNSKKNFFENFELFWIIQSPKTEAGIFHDPLKLCG